MMRKVYHLITGPICLFLCLSSCSNSEFDIKSDKIQLITAAASDSLRTGQFFPDPDVRNKLHDEFMHFYKRRSHRLAWFDFDEPGGQVYVLLKALNAASEHGLPESYYDVETLEKRLTNLYNLDTLKERAEKRAKKIKTKAFLKHLHEQDTLRLKRIVQLDFMCTAAYLTYASHLHMGFIDPGEEKNWLAPPRKRNLAEYLENALRKNKIYKSLENLAPLNEQYTLLREHLQHFRKARENTILPISTTLKAGDEGPEVLKAKKRLSRWKGLDPGINSSEFDRRMVTTVKRFQKINGLERSGEINSQVLRLLNKPLSYWILKIETNLERMRWLHERFSQEYILINIPEYNLKVMKNKKPEIEMKVIVGTSYRKTPVFSDTLEYVVLNPTWTVPSSIAIKEMLPRIKKDPDYLFTRDFSLYEGWSSKAKELNPEDVNWDDVDSASWTYRIVENPGPENSLGKIKFMMPNDQAIYLHDTPASHLFDEKQRSFSHGCIRLEAPFILAEYLLDIDKKAILKHLNSNETRDIRLVKKIPVHIVYWSAWVDKEGMINFRDDIYEYDLNQQKKIKLKAEMLRTELNLDEMFAR